MSVVVDLVRGAAAGSAVFVVCVRRGLVGARRSVKGARCAKAIVVRSRVETIASVVKGRDVKRELVFARACRMVNVLMGNGAARSMVRVW